MANTPEQEQVEKIRDFIARLTVVNEYGMANYSKWEEFKKVNSSLYQEHLELADKILSLEGLAIISEDQSWPGIPRYGVDYLKACQEMIGAGFKRVIKVEAQD